MYITSLDSSRSIERFLSFFLAVLALDVPDSAFLPILQCIIKAGSQEKMGAHTILSSAWNVLFGPGIKLRSGQADPSFHTGTALLTQERP